MSFRESQINLRARLNEKMTEKAYAKLASSVSDPQDRVVFRTDDAEMLDSAVKTCLQYYGTEAGPVPEGTQQAEERIDYLCRRGSCIGLSAWKEPGMKTGSAPCWQSWRTVPRWRWRRTA